MATQTPLTPKIALMVGAHADDIDFCASGTVAKWAQNGTEVHYLVITDGSKGSDDPAVSCEQLVARREQEQRSAAKYLGAARVHFLHYEDAMLQVTPELKKDVVRTIRQVRPDTVVVMDPTFIYSADHGFINHPDHRAAGQATLDAVYPLARDCLTYPDLRTSEKLEPHKVKHVLLINFERQNFFIDISDVFETKVSGLLMHTSQIPSPEGARSMLESWATSAGVKAGCRYAEGFMRIDVQ